MDAKVCFSMQIYLLKIFCCKKTFLLSAYWCLSNDLKIKQYKFKKNVSLGFPKSLFCVCVNEF